VAPEAVNVITEFKQTVELVAEIVIEGVGLTFKLTVADLVQPLLVPETVYVVLIEGVTVTEALFEEIGFHV
jgi:hypothetical protein